MDICRRCGKEKKENNIILLTTVEGERPEPICGDCFNQYMANILEVEDYKDFKSVVDVKDCDGFNHRFQISKRIHPTGMCWEANEYTDDEKIGYSFSVYQEFREGSQEAVNKLHKKIKKGLSKKYIKREVFHGQEFLILKHNKAEGRILWDDEFEGRIPKFMIDGQEYTLEKLGEMMMAYEGWDFKLQIKEPTE